MANADSGLTARVTCSFRFEAAHRLPLHPGRCRELHGHSYRIEVTVVGRIAADGMVMDFDRIEEIVGQEILGQWDHSYLNDLFDNPTAELIAWEAFDRLGAAGLPVETVRLWETQDAWVEVGQ